MVKRPNPQSRERGFTVVEVTIVVAISVVLFLAVGALTDASGTSMDYLSRTHRVDRDLRRALADISADLKRCSAGGLVHDTSDTDHDLITLQVPNPNGVGAPQWGYFQEDGAFQAGWSAQYIVLGDDLVLRRLDDTNNPQGDRILCRHVDVAFDDGSGVEKGFRVAMNGTLATITVRVHETFRDGRDYRRIETTTVNVSNP